MIDNSEVIGLALTDFGEPATIEGTTLQVLPCLDREERLAGEVVEGDLPYALASAAAVAALDIAAGNDGDILTISEIDYTVLAIDPDGSGMVILTLEERP